MMDELFMKRALELASLAQSEGEIPVGAVVVKDGVIIGEGKNTRETKNIVTGHAEIEAINSAAAKIGDWRLTGCTLYVTLEPCPMCAATAEQARISRIVYGSDDIKMGAAGGKINYFAYDFSSPVSITPFVLRKECDDMLQGFFENKRIQA